MDKNKIVEIARSYVGVPYLHQGRNRNGLDCIGLVLAVAKDLGMEIDDTPYVYEMVPSPEILYRGCDDHFKREITYSRGDFVLIRFHIDPQHAAIIAGDTMIHSYQKAGQVVEHRLSKQWKARILRTYSYE